MSLVSNGTIYYINSDNRLSGTSSDFYYQIQQPPNTNYDRCCVLQMSIPKSYYIVQVNEYFDLTENSSSVNITVPTGNYSRKSFSTVVQSLLNTYSPNGYTYTITYPNSTTTSDTGLYTFTVSGNGGVQPEIIFSTSNDLNSHMGFASGSTNIFVGNTLTSTQVINLQADNCLYLHSDLSTNGNDSVLQEVFANVSADFSSITFQQQCVEGYSKVITSNSSNVYRFYLADENDKALNLNGQNLNITLLLYKKNDLYDMIKQFIKLKTIQN
jgi:hypothetical protein